MKLHGTQTFCEIAWLQTSVLGLEEDKITWHSNNATLWCVITELSNSVTRSYGALEKSEIAWFSNLVLRLGLILYGLEECEITWCSSPTPVENHECTGLEEDKITWYSNIRQLTNQTGLEGCEITWFSNNSVPFICYTLDLEGCEIAGCSNRYSLYCQVF